MKPTDERPDLKRMTPQEAEASAPPPGSFPNRDPSGPPLAPYMHCGGCESKFYCRGANVRILDDVTIEIRCPVCKQKHHVAPKEIAGLYVAEESRTEGSILSVASLFLGLASMADDRERRRDGERIEAEKKLNATLAELTAIVKASHPEPTITTPPVLRPTLNVRCVCENCKMDYIACDATVFVDRDSTGVALSIIESHCPSCHLMTRSTVGVK